MYEHTGVSDPRPSISNGDGFVINAGRWEQSETGAAIAVDLRCVGGDKLIGVAVGDERSFHLELHGLHLVDEKTAYEPLELAYPKNESSLRDQFFERACIEPDVKTTFSECGRNATVRTGEESSDDE